MIYPLPQLLAEQQASGQSWLEFLRTADLSMGLYHLPAGTADLQQPHTEDETYYVLAGAGQIHISGREHPVQTGDVIYVPKLAIHYFHTITADLTLLVFFAPAEGSQAPNPSIT